MEEIKIKSTIPLKNTGCFHSKIDKIIFLQTISIILLFFFLVLFRVQNYKILINESIKKKKSNSKETLSKKIELLKIITNNDESEYKGIQECLLNDPDQKYCIYHLILPKIVLGKNRIIVGGKREGGYVLLDDFKNIKIAYSFGIGKIIHFDKALADKGINIYMYDHTIDRLPFQNPKFHWKKIGLCGVGQKIPNLKNLEELIIENGHTKEKDMILKIDIEHWEWESLLYLKENILNQFKYIAIEYHFKERNFYKDEHLYYNVLKKISKTHQAFYSRCNQIRSFKINFGYNRICHILEVSYIIKKDNEFKNDETIYPIYEFDPSKPETGKLEMNLNVLKLFNDD